MEIAYLILAHNNVNQLVHLIKRLDGENVSFVIHFDKNGSDEDFKSLQNSFSKKNNVHFTNNRIKCYWANFTLVKATIECIETLLNGGISFDYAFFISGQDYPLKSNDEIQEFLREKNGKEFIESFELPYNKWAGGGLNRLEFFNFNKYHRNETSVKKKLLVGLTEVLRKIGVKRTLPKMKFYCGSQWWCLSKEAISYIFDFINKNKKFVNFFEHSRCPDEIFFQTILLNSPLKNNVVNNTLRYIDWSRPHQKPSIFDANDFESLINSGQLFARKLDMNVNKGIFELLDQNAMKQLKF